MIQKYVSLLSSSARNFEKTIMDFEKKKFDGYHFDVMDGHFVKNFAFGPGIIKSLRKLTALPFQAHLEIENPGEYLDMFMGCGCNIITLHPQTCDIERELRYLKARNITASVAIDPDIKVEAVSGYLNLIDNIVVMSVYPGFGKQRFLENSLIKIRKLKEIISKNNLDITISIDGGVSKETEGKIIESGCDIMIYGSSLFE